MSTCPPGDGACTSCTGRRALRLAAASSRATIISSHTVLSSHTTLSSHAVLGGRPDIDSVTRGNSTALHSWHAGGDIWHVWAGGHGTNAHLARRR